MISLLETNLHLVDRVFLVLADVPATDIDLFLTHVQDRYHLTLELVPSHHLSLDSHYVSGHISAAAYLRLHLGELLPDSVSTILYLDSDVIVVRDMSTLLGQSLAVVEGNKNLVIAAVDEPSSGDHLRPLGFRGTRYLNSGVLLIDLDRWRNAGVGPQLDAIATNFGDKLTVWDQDAFNLYFDDSWLSLDDRLNWIRKDIGDESPVIVHFVSGDKPWKLGNRHPARHLYRHYRNLTPFPYRYQWDLQNLYRNLLPSSWRQQLQPVMRLLRRVRLLTSYRNHQTTNKQGGVRSG